LYKLFVNLFKKVNIVFSYLYGDELYTFYTKKDHKLYIWIAVGVTKRGIKFYFYFLSKKKDIESLLSFNFDLLKVERHYIDGNTNWQWKMDNGKCKNIEIMKILNIFKVID